MSKIMTVSSIARKVKNEIIGGLVVSILTFLDYIPYKRRLTCFAFLLNRVISPLSGYRKRIIANLNYIYPDMPASEHPALIHSMQCNIGKTMCEMFSRKDVEILAAQSHGGGEGYHAIFDAVAEKKPVILVSGHFGSFDVIRHHLKHKGIENGTLYKPFSIPKINKLWRDRIGGEGCVAFPTTPRGIAKMVLYLKAGNVVSMLNDQYAGSGEKLDFMGKPAYTATSAAKMALKYNALLIPCYALRHKDGLLFDMIFEAPIEHTNATEMTQKLNDSLSNQVHQHKDAWFWVHRRWKNT